MSKTLVYTAPDRMIAESYAAELRDAGIPVKVEFSMGLDESFPVGPAELWVDDEVLDDPDVGVRIAEILESVPLSDQDEEAISSLRFSDVPVKQASSKGRRLSSTLKLLAVLVAVPATIFLFFWVLSNWGLVMGFVALTFLLIWVVRFSVHKLRLE